MTLFAKIENGIVVNVIVASQEEINKNYSGVWIESKNDNSLRKQGAGIGMSYDSNKDKFIAKKPYPSWRLDYNDDWQSPIPKPNDGKRHKWNENNLTWDE